MSGLPERLEAVTAYLEADAAGDAKDKWAKGHRQACADHVAVLRLVLEEDEASVGQRMAEEAEKYANGERS